MNNFPVILASLAVALGILSTFLLVVVMTVILRRRRLGYVLPPDAPSYRSIDTLHSPGPGQAQIDADTLALALKYTHFAAADPAADRPPAMSGVILHARDGRLHIAATDGRRIAVYSPPDTTAAADFCAVLPAPQVGGLRRALARRHGPLTLTVTDQHLIVDGGGRGAEAYAHLTADYPAYWQIIPPGLSGPLALPVVTLAQALRQRLTDRPQLSFEIYPGRLLIEGASETIQYQGAPCAFLIDGELLRPLTELKADVLQLHVSPQGGPVVIDGIPHWRYAILQTS